jgi:tRNA A-37 threonylcarbamoyl transferase component Bud32
VLGLGLNKELNDNVLGFCRRIAGSNQIVGICVYGSVVLNDSSTEVDVEVLAVIRDFQPRIMVYVKPLNKHSLAVSAVDQWVFEKDVEKAFIGEVAAEKIIFGYHALKGEGYFKKQETAVKKRIIRELLENLVLEFPELSRELLIEPEYFLYETMMRRARLFPVITNYFLTMLKKRKAKEVMEGYITAIEKLEKEGIISFSNGYIRINEKFIEKVKSKKLRIPVFFKNFQKAFFAYTLGILPKTLNVFSQYREKLFKLWNVNEEELIFRLENPRKHIHISTPLGKVPLSDRTDIKDFARKIVSSKADSSIEIEDIGGILNDVYLIKLKENNHERKIVAKRFMDWQNFKWFTLALWALGTQSFAVQGRSRLEREYAINKLLEVGGIRVPKILHVSLEKRLIFREYVEGEKMTEVIKRIFKAKRKSDVAEELQRVEEVGKKIAQVHKLDVSLGDAKPENIIISDNEILFLDLEQASKNGNQAWDIAEFLYYSGHYVSLAMDTKSVMWLTKAFVKGYLAAGGKRLNVEKAVSPLYTKVFSIFTLPHVILLISNMCKKLANERREI